MRRETSPDDYHGMIVAQGILTSQGGTGSHAAVVARGAGLPAVVGCDALRVDYDARQFTLKDGQTVREGDVLSIDGTTGVVYLGAIETVEPNFAEEKDLQTLLGWADKYRRLGVWANADYPARRRARGDVWRGGHRPLPHRAHVHGAGAPAHRAGDDPRADEEGAGSRARQAAALPARRLRGRLPRHARPQDRRGLSRRHPPDRPAAARVPAELRGVAGRGDAAGGRQGRQEGAGRKAQDCWRRSRECAR